MKEEKRLTKPDGHRKLSENKEKKKKCGKTLYMFCAYYYSTGGCYGCPIYG